MLVYITFDVEDIVHPDTDDIALDIATMLADEGIVASMYVTGDKARIWERRGRTDVIAAVGQHDVGLHTDHHSVHPTVSEYLQDKGWADGVAEAIGQEGPGARDLARLFGRFPSSWATSGSSWGPQIPAATHQLGIPAHVYAHVRSGDSGACWFAGQFCFSDPVFHPDGEDIYADDAHFETALPIILDHVAAAQRSGQACLGVFGAHPTRLRYTMFWDEINFARGVNTAPADYRFAPRRTDAAYQTSLRNLRRMILAVRDLPGIQIRSTQSITRQFGEENRPLPWQAVGRLAQVALDSDAIDAENPAASPAQTLDLISRALLRAAAGQRPAFLPLRTVLGPVEQPPILDRTVTTKCEVGFAACHTLVQHVAQSGHLPVSVAIQDRHVGPGALLRASAAALLALERGQTLDEMTFTPGAEEPAVAVSLAQAGIYQKLPYWPPHSPDLRLDLLALHTRLQTWSLKPASLGREAPN